MPPAEWAPHCFLHRVIRAKIAVAGIAMRRRVEEAGA